MVIKEALQYEVHGFCVEYVYYLICVKTFEIGKSMILVHECSKRETTEHKLNRMRDTKKISCISGDVRLYNYTVLSVLCMQAFPETS